MRPMSLWTSWIAELLEGPRRRDEERDRVPACHLERPADAHREGVRHAPQFRAIGSLRSDAVRDNRPVTVSWPPSRDVRRFGSVRSAGEDWPLTWEGPPRTTHRDLGVAGDLDGRRGLGPGELSRPRRPRDRNEVDVVPVCDVPATWTADRASVRVTTTTVVRAGTGARPRGLRRSAPTRRSRRRRPARRGARAR